MYGPLSGCHSAFAGNSARAYGHAAFLVPGYAAIPSEVYGDYE